MKNYIYTFLVAISSLLIITGCQDDDHTFGSINAPDNLNIVAEIVGKDASHPDGDGSGKVNFIATANNALNYKYIFSDGSSQSTQSGKYQKRFNITGVNTYQVTVLASGTGGASTTKTIEVTVQSDFSDDEALQFLTGGGTKKWYWAAAEAGHLGVGPNNDNSAQNGSPIWYAAAPFEKANSPESSCLYDNELTFIKDGNDLKFTLNNQGKTFFNVAFNSVVGATSTSDGCYTYNTSGTKNVILGPSDSILTTTNPTATRGTTMTFSDGGFMGYYIGQTKYEILSITDNRMVVRAVMGNDNAIAWYHIFTTSPPSQGTDFTNLVWQDEFNVDGAPDSSKWVLETGRGPNNDGWGNNEQQYYTTSSNNVSISGGTLKITAIRENFNGSPFTSARLKTQGKFDFKYGKVVMRAKLPTGGGTWPALWMLGSNITSVPWPDCGEIDIMEHVGNQQNTVFSTLHYPGHSGGNGVSGNTTNATASSAFHEYSVVWTDTVIKFYIDNVQFHTFANTSSTPFNQNFFLLLNFAMGGNFGGAIDSSFTQSTYEIDYVKVYQ